MTSMSVDACRLDARPKGASMIRSAVAMAFLVGVMASGTAAAQSIESDNTVAIAAAVSQDNDNVIASDDDDIVAIDASASAASDGDLNSNVSGNLTINVVDGETSVGLSDSISDVSGVTS